MATEGIIWVTALGIGTVTLNKLEPWVQARIRQQIKKVVAQKEN